MMLEVAFAWVPGVFFLGLVVIYATVEAWIVGEVFGCWESGWKVGEMFGSRWFFFGFGCVSGHRAQWVKCLVDGKMARKWKKKRIGDFF